MVKIAILQKLSNIADKLDSKGFALEANSIVTLMQKIAEFDDSKIAPGIMEQLTSPTPEQSIPETGQASAEFDMLDQFKHFVDELGSENAVAHYIETRDTLAHKLKDMLRNRKPLKGNSLVVYWSPKTNNFEYNWLNTFLENGKRAKNLIVCQITVDNGRITYDEPFWDMIYDGARPQSYDDDGA